MKNLLLTIFTIGAIGLASCGGDDDGCKTCEVGLLGITVETEICQDGDNVVTTSQGVTDTVFNSTVDEVAAGFEALGSCN